MKNRTKGAVAGVAGVALLAGGTTFALWSDSDDLDGGTITNGNLDVAALQTTWKDVSYDRADSPHDIDLATWQMVPGDTIEGTQGFDVALDGDNLVANLTLADTGASTLPPGVTVQYDVVQGDQVLATAPLGTPVPVELQSIDNPDELGRTEVGETLDGVADLSVVVRVSFDADNRDQVLETSTLSGLSVTLEQIRR
ncbi:alternate-type signal peptide domain-containing protein [Cellulomonas shaoxiangyii]|uniref:Alternate-type signal peptide domain-containing protein n=1 Tax=Cellulomonas shaoxiangyii TaxID=2566013 RepID=A0A4P7SJI1_9CELL|nr:alternate-type signal peptide domain-containing protein [Cellulomonas shaoxiangyii]QCB93858.1 alternate-type signal peptide domain-containing protein [Cellulomonas shaoxiangyii]TGY84583.1 alternate-type signal peptide domain-containing protein [Cellulomonas shaoxiangyii]